MIEFQIKKGRLTLNGSKKAARKALKAFAKTRQGVPVAVATCSSLKKLELLATFGAAG